LNGREALESGPWLKASGALATAVLENRAPDHSSVTAMLTTERTTNVNAAGDVLLQKKIASDPAAIVHLLKSFHSPFKRIGLEAGPTSSWLCSELRAAVCSAICLECRHVKAG
jgi:transposase